MADNTLDMFGESNPEEVIDKIVKVPFGGYTGNKRKILGHIWNVIDKKESIEFDSVFDAFSGSAVVSMFFKFMGKKVVSNDFLTSSYLNAKALIENDGSFFSDEDMKFVVYNEPDFDVEDGFVYKNFKDIRFTEKECVDLDRFNHNLSLMDSDLYDKEIAFASRGMQNSILTNCFLGGRYSNGQVIANLEHRLKHNKHKSSRKKDVNFTEQLMSDYNRNKDRFKNWCNDGFVQGTAYNDDVINLLENSDFVTDIAYIDPPYGGASTDYAFLYQFLEEYIHEKKLDDMEHVQKFGKRFVKKKTYEENFVRMLELMDRFPVWVLSYNDSSWESKEYIVGLLKKFKKYVEVYEVDNYVYNYRSEKNKNSGVEYLFVAK
jgi:adenine-specific DNA-methyltransferase